MTLATGILVDDAIVEIENIARHIRMGKTPYRAAIEAADEIGLAVIATTFTIVAVFVPVSFMPGIPGQYFRQFGLTVAIAVFFSLLVARLITPMMAAYLMRDKDARRARSEKDGCIMRGYTCARDGTTTGHLVLAATRRFSAPSPSWSCSVFCMVSIPGSFIPPEDACARHSRRVELPPGATLEDTDRATPADRTSDQGHRRRGERLRAGRLLAEGRPRLRRAAVTVILEKLDHSLRQQARQRACSAACRWSADYLPKLQPTRAARGRRWDIEAEIFDRDHATSPTSASSSSTTAASATSAFNSCRPTRPT